MSQTEKNVEEIRSCKILGDNTLWFKRPERSSDHVYCRASHDPVAMVCIQYLEESTPCRLRYCPPKIHMTP